MTSTTRAAFTAINILALALFAALVWFFCQRLPPDFEHHFSPAENLEKIDVALLGRAERSIDIAAYVLTDVAMIDALAEAQARGVRVRLYRDPSLTIDTGPVGVAIAQLRAMSPDIRIKHNDAALMHLKAYCVDGKTLRTGAANFSASGLKRQDNDLLIVRGPHACAAFTANFERIFAQ